LGSFFIEFKFVTLPKIRIMNTNIFESTSEANDSDVVENKLDDFYYELSGEDIRNLEIAKQQSKEGKTIDMEDMLTKLEQEYAC
jgi:hypothetical protein